MRRWSRNGDVYSCGHYVYPEYRLGNVRERSLGGMVFSPGQVRFGYAESETLPSYCKQCTFVTDCWGECPKNRLLRTPDGEPGLNYLCAGLKRFYSHAVPVARKVAGRIRAGAVIAGAGRRVMASSGCRGGLGGPLPAGSARTPTATCMETDGSHESNPGIRHAPALPNQA